MLRDREPLTVEVLAPILAPATPFRPREWSQAREESYRLLLLLDGLAERFRGRVTIYLIDPFSLQGLFKVTRFRIRKFPTFVIGGRHRYNGWDLEELGRQIERHLGGP